MLDEEMLEKIELLNSYNINVKENRYLLGKSYVELENRIKYLINNNIPLEIEGKLHEVFWVSYKRLEKKYGITKEALLTQKEKVKTR